jgi:hypothetical protein
MVVRPISRDAFMAVCFEVENLSYYVVHRHGCLNCIKIVHYHDAAVFFNK